MMLAWMCQPLGLAFDEQPFQYITLFLSLLFLALLAREAWRRPAARGWAILAISVLILTAIFYAAILFTDLDCDRALFQVLSAVLRLHSTLVIGLGNWLMIRRYMRQQ